VPPAGRRAVLDGLRQTLIGGNGIQEIELRLRNDCAAFFEWIQGAPTCHVLTRAVVGAYFGGRVG
jgi:hypothetical protein